MMRSPITYNTQDPQEEVVISSNSLSILGSKKVLLTDATAEDEGGKKVGRPKKKLKVDMNTDDGPSNLTSAQSNRPYSESYVDTNGMLKSSIVQIDMLNSELQSELTNVRNSKTLKKKFDYVAAIAATSGSLLGTKISAIKEMNKIITDCHNLELKKIKELKIDNTVNDDKHIMDMYNAFISAPMGSDYNMQMAPSIMDATLAGTVGMIASEINNNTDVGYQSYLNNITPEQNRMRYENNPNIQTVVRYDQNTGGRRFDVVDVSTGMSVPNMPIPPEIVLDDLTINVRTGIARNSNTNMEFPIIMEGNYSSLSEY